MWKGGRLVGVEAKNLLKIERGEVTDITYACGNF